MNLIPIYSIPLWQSEYPDFEDQKDVILSAIKKYKEETPPKEKSRSSLFGYQSLDTLYTVEELDPIFEYICQVLYKAVSDLEFIDCDVALTAAWLNVNDSRQCMNAEHIHEGVFSVVFYVKAPEGSGKIVLQNPAINRLWNGCNFAEHKNQFTGESIKIEPVEGNILVFPSYLPHYVETNDHDDERISISFNAITVPKGMIPQSSDNE